jgi:hypothetical protein
LPSGEEIQAALRRFVSDWSDYTGTERSEAQTFLNQLFACYGGDRRELGAKFEDFSASAGFMDLHWPGVCIIEMKAPSRELAVAQPQIERYWRESADMEAGIRAARWVVSSNFREFEIWEPGAFPTRPVARFALADLPDRYDALAFLAGPHVEPSFAEHYRELTKDAAQKVSAVYQSLADRHAAPRAEIQRFVLQSVWCMFADDLHMLEDYPFQATLNAAAADPDNSAALVGFLFQVLNQKTDTNRHGRLAGTRYVNGALFAKPALIRLTRDEIRLLLEATAFDWRKVDPTIFGSLMEGVLGRERRWEVGAHYTHEVDIMKIVGPTVVRPWRERIEATATPQQARDLLEELCRFKVLDPACGCGNFLYVAYRELRGLEHELKQRIQLLASETGLPVPDGDLPFYPLRNMQGIDIERAAVEIAKVTLWMGHRQMIDRYGEAEPPLPLQDLSGIQQADALRVEWPETDCIVGNPPFLGDRLLRRTLGDDYVAWLKDEFDGHMVDLSAYWFRKAADHLKPGQRAGLVSTNTLRENKHRRASLDYLVARGGVITDAVSSQKWPGDAKVHVSLTNWVAHPSVAPSTFSIDGMPVQNISTQLREGVVPADAPLAANRGRSFIGCQPTGEGFIVSADEASHLITEDPGNSDVVRRYLVGDDLTNDPRQEPTRWIIDFGTRTLEDASRYSEPIKIVRLRVKPGREGAARHFERLWWQFAWPPTRHACSRQWT